MKNSLFVFLACSISAFTSCSSWKNSEQVVRIDAVKPPNLVISGDTAYFVEDSLLLSTARSHTPDTTGKYGVDHDPNKKEPRFVRRVLPNCPSEAISKSISGTTNTKVWVDTLGNPRMAIIIESTNPIFNRPSLIAAMQWKFTRAMMTKGPVAVWLSVPLYFHCPY
jgi:hypothetical protein